MADGMPGAPKAIIDWKKVDDLLIAGCSGREIAGHIGINPATIYDRCLTDNGIPFSEYSQQKYSKGESLLRAKQFEKALKNGDNMMLIWLGKNRLGQRDKEPETQSNQEIVFKVNYVGANNPIEISSETVPTSNTGSTQQGD